MDAQIDPDFIGRTDVTRLLHIVNGDATGEPLGRSGVPGEILVWADPLHDGPVIPDEDRSAWLDARARHLCDPTASSGQSSYEQIRAAAAGCERTLETWRDFDEVVMWFEHDLFDQLLLVHHLHWFARRDPTIDRLRLICIDRFPGVEPFHGLGQLSPAQLATLVETREIVRADRLALGERVWRALTADNPMTLDAIAREDMAILPFLAAALTRFLQDFPSTRNGLARSEEQILRSLEGGPLDPVALFRATQGMEERVFMGDMSFWSIVERLAAGVSPALRLDVRTSSSWRLPEGHVELTETGRDLLSGSRDWVETNGIDRWMGGVHLEGRTVAWRWNAHPPARAALTHCGP